MRPREIMVKLARSGPDRSAVESEHRVSQSGPTRTPSPPFPSLPSFLPFLVVRAQSPRSLKEGEGIKKAFELFAGVNQIDIKVKMSWIGHVVRSEVAAAQGRVEHIMLQLHALAGMI